MARRIGPYEVVRELGRGGMGVVFEVRDPALPRRLALKLILDKTDPDALERFGREVELMARIRHPNVVAVHTLGRAPDGPYVVMDLVEGEPLSRLVERIEPTRAVDIVRALCDAVGAVHAQGILHRDLKPQNVIVRPDGTPVLLDFGLARSGSAQSLTRTGALVGTPRYMAPEQAEGKGARPLDARTDVYGLGAILFELLAGEPPFVDVDGGPWAVIVAVVQREPRWPGPERGVPPGLQDVLRRAMAKRTDERYPSAAALREALVQARAQPLPPAARRGGRARRVALVAGAVASLVAGAFIHLALRPPAPAAAPADVEAPRSRVGAGDVGRPVGGQTAGAPGPAPPARDEPRADRPMHSMDLPGGPKEYAALAWRGAELVTGTSAYVALWATHTPARPEVMFSLPPEAQGIGRHLATAGRSLFCAGANRVGRLDLDAAPPLLDARLIEGDWSASALAGARDGRLALGAFNVSAVLIYGPGVERPPTRLVLPGAMRAHDLVFTDDGRHLAAATPGRREAPTLRLWACDTGEEVAGWSDPLGAFVSVAYAPPPAGWLAAGTDLGGLRLFDPAGAGEVGTFVAADASEERFLQQSAHTARVQALSFSPAGDVLYSLSLDLERVDAPSELRVWAVADRRQLRSVELSGRYGAVAASPDGRWLALARVGGVVELWSAEALARPEAASPGRR